MEMLELSIAANTMSSYYRWNALLFYLSVPGGAGRQDLAVGFAGATGPATVVLSRPMLVSAL